MNISIDTNEACHGRSVSIKEEMAAVDELQEGSVGHNTAEHELSPSEYTGIETSSATPQSSPATRMSDATNMGVGDRSVFGDELGCVVKLEAESDSVSHFARTESQVKAESMLTIHCSGYDSSAELSAGQVKLQTITPNSGEVKQEIMMDESPSEMLLDQNFRNNTHSVKLGCESVDHNRDDDDERTEPASVSGNKSICSRSSSEVPTLGQENGCLLAKFITKQTLSAVPQIDADEDNEQAHQVPAALSIAAVDVNRATAPARTPRPWAVGRQDKYTCKDCGMVFQGQSRFNKHVLKHSDERPFTCGECGEAFTSASHLQGHERRHSSIKPFMCAICGETFKHGRLLTEHRRSHAEEGAFACSDCGRKCSNPRELTKHIQSVHPDNPSNRPHVCSLCPAAFQRRYHLKTHMRSHTGEKPYKCDMCGQSYSTQGTLKVHIRSHTGERPYKCVECGRGFITSGQLKKHSRTHNKPVITVSEDNSTVYVQTLKPVPHLSEDREEDGGDMEGEETATLKLEIESYPKDCTYSCSLCEERVFLRPIDLASHMRHDHPQPVKKESVCPDCGLIFSRPHTLKIHMKAHLGGKLFKCNTCGKEFAQKNNLTAHIQTHSLC